MNKRRSIQEINNAMDTINKRKPSKNQIEDLAKVIKKINEEKRTLINHLDFKGESLDD